LLTRRAPYALFRLLPNMPLVVEATNID
jgi:hypothetical protein